MKLRNFVLVAMVGVLSGCQQERPPGSPTPVGAATPADGRADHARFLGVWSGRWGDCLDGKLTVASMEQSGAMAGEYSFGNCADWNITAGSRPVRGQINAGTLTLEPFGNGARVSYRMAADGSLAGTYRIQREVTLGTFRKE